MEELNSVKSWTAEDYLHSIGQMNLTLGKANPRLTTVGKLDFRLQRMQSDYTKEDPISS